MYSAPCLVRLWIHAHASVLATFGRFLQWYFYGPLFLAVACSTVLARGVQVRRFPGSRLPEKPCSALLGLTVDTFSSCIASGGHLLGACCLESTVLGFVWKMTVAMVCLLGVYDHFAPEPAWLFDSLGNSTESVVWFGFLSVDDVRTPVEGLVRRLPSLCAWLPILELLCPTGPRRAVHPGSQVPLDCPLHPRYCAFLAHLVSSTGVSLRCSVLSRIRVRGSCWTFSAPQAVFRSWCRLRVVTRVFLRVAGRPRYVGAESWGRLFWCPVHRHSARGAMSTGTWPPRIRCTF